MVLSAEEEIAIEKVKHDLKVDLLEREFEIFVKKIELIKTMEVK